MKTAESEYVSFLVRMWCQPENSGQWLIQVELIPSGAKQHFDTLSDFISFVQKLTDERKEEQDVH